MQLPKSSHIPALTNDGWTPTSPTHCLKLTSVSTSEDASNKFRDNRVTKWRLLFPTPQGVYKERCQRVGDLRPDISEQGDFLQAVSGRYTDCQLTDESTRCTHLNPRQSIKYQDLQESSFTSLVPDRADIYWFTSCGRLSSEIYINGNYATKKSPFWE
jgi:hypothetical protein